MSDRTMSNKKNKKGKVKKGSISGYMLTDEEMTRMIEESTVSPTDKVHKPKRKEGNSYGKEKE